MLDKRNVTSQFQQVYRKQKPDRNLKLTLYRPSNRQITPTFSVGCTFSTTCHKHHNVNDNKIEKLITLEHTLAPQFADFKRQKPIKIGSATLTKMLSTPYT